jgi:hypothetical protein
MGYQLVSSIVRLGERFFVLEHKPQQKQNSRRFLVCGSFAFMTERDAIVLKTSSPRSIVGSG